MNVATPATGRRADILRSALELFNARGYAATSIQDIAAHAPASVGSIYHHFGGKEEIAASIYVDGLADYHRGLLRELRRERKGAEEAVRAIVHHHLRWVRRNRPVARFLFTSRDPEVAGATAEELGRMNRRVFEAVEERMAAWIQAGEVRGLPLTLLHAVLLGPSQEFARHWVAGRARESIDEAEPVLADAAWKAVRA